MAQSVRRLRTGYITRVENRVRAVIPEWPTWTRKLRRIFILLETYGPTDNGIREMCADFKWSWDETQKLIEETDSFKVALDAYRDGGRYPMLPGWKKGGLTGIELQTLYAYESGIVQFMHLEDRRGQSSFGVKLAESTGLLGVDSDTEDGRDKQEQPSRENTLPDWSVLEITEDEEAEPLFNPQKIPG
jgi:hypothetical protein